MNSTTSDQPIPTSAERPSTPDAPITVVYIVSCPFSGSTWLNLLLASHPRAFGVGEMDKFDRDYGKVLCNVHGADCPFWNRFDPQSSEDRYVQVARLSGRDVIVNNNKPPEAIGDHKDPRIRGKYIFLIRDGRAVAASRLRKKPNERLRNVARWWAAVHHSKYDAFARFPAADRLEVHYEALMADTPGQLRRICDFLGLDYQPEMLEYWKVDHHLIAGNIGTQLAMVRKVNKDLPTESVEASLKRDYKWEGSLSYYQKADAANFQDERWKSEFGPWKRFVFWLNAGSLNHKLGYGPQGLAKNP